MKSILFIFKQNAMDKHSRRGSKQPQIPHLSSNYIWIIKTPHLSGFGGLELACWPLVSNFTGSNPAEAVGFFRAKKSSARLPSEGR
jgi:hypothetical protein